MSSSLPPLKPPVVPSGENRLVQHGETPVCVFNIDGKLFALDDRCPHRAGPLSEGKIENGEVTCPWHGSRFRVSDGKCLAPPATRDARVVPLK